MTTQHIAQLGIAFLVVGFAATFLMYHLWGYPFDKAKRLSAAPRWAMYLHRGLGYLFVACYVAIMVHMVPRLWEYQVEFPARTVAHIILGFSVGFLLIVKIAIMRFFRHFEEWMPYLGTGILWGSVLLLGLSLPIVFHERGLSARAPGGDALSEASRARVAEMLPHAELPAGVDLATLSTASSLARGREVLLSNCVKCHDLRTILAQPRTPRGWWTTVARMGEKPALFAPLTEEEQHQVTAYLIAISPDLQRSVKRKRDEELARQQALATAMPAIAPAEPDPATAPAPGPALAPGATPVIDRAKAKAVYEDVCAQCHDLTDVDAAPPTTADEARELVSRMITENEAEMTAEEIELTTFWLIEVFVRKAP